MIWTKVSEEVSTALCVSWNFFLEIGDVLNLVFLTVSLVSGSLCRLQVAALAGLLPSYCVVVTVVFRIPCHSMKLFYVRATCELFASKYS